MMRLYDSTISGNCYKIRLLMSLLGIPYTRVEVDIERREHRQEMLGDKTAIRRVPVLELEDGRCFGESNAILWFLGNGTRYLESDPVGRALTLQWMFFEQNCHEPNIAVVRHWIHLGEAERRHAMVEEKRKAGYAALEVMQRHLEQSPFCVGRRYSIADIALYAYTHVAHEGGFNLEKFPAVREWLGRVEDQPGHVAMTAEPGGSSTH